MINNIWQSPRNFLLAKICLVLLLSGMLGCSRTPSVEYYTLMPPPSANGGAYRADGLPKILVVLPTIPALVDRNEFTELGAENRVLVHENVRWATGLRKTLRDYFIVHLKQDIPTLDISSSANQAVVPGGRKLLMIFSQFTIHTGQHVEISMNWRLLGTEKKLFEQSSPASQKNEITVKQDITGDQASDAIAAIRTALGVIGDEMAQTLVQEH